MIYIKVCPICGKEFETTKTKVKYCSSVCACKSKSIKAVKYVKRVQHVPKTCEECGKEFIPKSKLSRFCSEDCKRIYAAKKRKRNIQPKACASCGKEFTPNSNYAKYCSNECRREGTRRAWKSGKYQYDKDDGIEKPKKENSAKKSPAQRRWEKMSWKELSAECARLHLSYGQAQVMAMNGTLPEDFGLKSKISQKGDCPQSEKI